MELKKRGKGNEAASTTCFKTNQRRTKGLFQPGWKREGVERKKTIIQKKRGALGGNLSVVGKCVGNFGDSAKPSKSTEQGKHEKGGGGEQYWLYPGAVPAGGGRATGLKFEAHFERDIYEEVTRNKMAPSKWGGSSNAENSNKRKMEKNAVQTSHFRTAYGVNVLR